MSTEFCLSTNNEKVYKFFKERHPGLNFEEFVLLFIDLVEKLTENVSASLNSTMFMSLFDNVKQLQTQVDHISRLQTDNNSHLALKLSEFKREYIEDVKLILSNNVSDKIAPLIREQNGILMDKTNLLLNDILPKSNDQLSKQLSISIKDMQKTIVDDTHKFLSNSSISPQSLQEFVNNLDSKLSSSLLSSQALYTAAEKRLDTSIREIKASSDANLGVIKELSSSNQQISSSLTSSVSEMLKKMENSSSKGKISENILFGALHSLYPCAQIDSVGTTKETGDIMLCRKEKPRILVENKNWDKNVVQEEVKKFLHDVETQNCCGLFLAQNYGIANKEDFEINIHNGNVLVYVHKANNDPDKIKVAVSIIDHLKARLDQIDDKSEVDVISKERLDNINQEYIAFANQKLAMIKHVKDFQTKLVKMIDDVRLPSLEEHLNTRYAASSSKVTCQYCESFQAKNQQALSAHHRGCAKKKLIDPDS
jgi:hypothetical protein